MGIGWEVEMNHLNLRELKGYREGTMAAEGLVRADRHLATCGVCRRSLQLETSPPALPALAVEMAAPGHFSYEEMTEYVDSKLESAAREWMEQHMLVCQSCSMELRELASFDERLAVELNHVAEARPTVVESGWFQKVQERVARFVSAPPRWRLAGSGVGLMVIGVFAMLQMRVSGGGLHAASPGVARLSSLSPSTHPGFFYGGILIVAVGAIFLLDALFKKE
jgi:predicted anti-sigma-YlaC factor YlaD